MCIKFQSNTPILSKDIAWKPFVLRTGRADGCTYGQFVCIEVLRPSQPNGVMSSVVSLPNHMFTGQA